MKNLLSDLGYDPSGFSEKELVGCLVKFMQKNDRKSAKLKAQAEEIYEVYPYKQGRGKAITSIVKQLRVHGFDKLMSATRAFSQCWGEDLQWCPMATTWFNQERFLDPSSSWGPRDGGLALKQKIQSAIDMHVCNPESVNFHVYHGKPSPPSEKWAELAELKVKLNSMS